MPNKWIWGVVMGALVVVLAPRVVPYVFVPNSIPRTIRLSEPDRARLLGRQIERVAAVEGARCEEVLRAFAERDTEGLARDERSGGVKLAQTILARLLLGEDIERSNQILRELVVWGNAGSSWKRNQHGDYDFGLIWLTRILYAFGHDETRLYPETRAYLLKVLLTEQGQLERKVPRSGGLVFDTENHLLMREGSRYLKNQWLKAHGAVPARMDNARNGLEAWLEGHLNHLYQKGCYEYNSTPYVVYTMLPLMNLASYAESETIRRLAESVLDDILERYAYGSLALRQCAPFRRQFKYAENPSLRLNRLGGLVRFQLGGPVMAKDLLVLGSVVNDYRMPLATLHRFKDGAAADYFAVFGHEDQGGAELYSGGPGYLLSAGGAYQGQAASVIARPIALILEDDAETLDDTIHIQGIGGWKNWNMSGVHQRFAVAKGSLHLPERLGLQPRAGWNVFRVGSAIAVACYQKDDVVILLVLPPPSRVHADALKLLREANPNPEISNVFHWPAPLAPAGVATVGFDTEAAPADWVITSVNGSVPAPMKDSAFERWPAKRIQ